MRQFLGNVLLLWGVCALVSLGLPTASGDLTTEAKVYAGLIAVALIAVGSRLRGGADERADRRDHTPTRATASADRGSGLTAWGMVSVTVLFFGGLAGGLAAVFYGLSEWEAGVLVPAGLVAGWAALWALGRVLCLRMTA